MQPGTGEDRQSGATMAEVAQANTGSQAEGRRPRRTQVGVVEGVGRQKTIKVRLDRVVQHAKYGKYLRRQNTLQAHDEKNEAKRGDVVEIMECRPISKTKSWRLVRVVRASAAN
jgi:small subunit ribosomal protein S17